MADQLYQNTVVILYTEYCTTRLGYCTALPRYPTLIHCTTQMIYFMHHRATNKVLSVSLLFVSIVLLYILAELWQPDMS